MTTKKICINAMGIALFVVCSLCLQVPVFQNYYLCLGYVVMAFYLYFFGTFSGTIAGSLGVVIYCLIIGGLRGMPGWALGNLLIGILGGVASAIVHKQKNRRSKYVFMFAAVAVSVALGILVTKSMVETVLYGIPFFIRVMTNLYAFVADVVVLFGGFVLCISSEPLFRRLIPEDTR